MLRLGQSTWMGPRGAHRVAPFVLYSSITWLLTSLLAACGGGSSGTEPLAAGQSAPATSTTDQGEVIVSITDAPGDFILYDVAVAQIQLTRQNGDVVSALPLTTRVDFTELTEVTELLSIATVPAGIYTSANITLDFSDADIRVQNEIGDAVEATVIDNTGDSPGALQMRLDLTSNDQLRIAPGRPAAFSLDFDLDASNSIDLSTTPPTVTVEPFLLATPELEIDREHRVRGLLAAVTPETASFNVAVRPFRHRSGDFGRITLMTDENTAYDVDGVAYIGADGLAALSAIESRAPIVALAQIQSSDEAADSQRGLLANEVIAGTSVAGVNADFVKGVVVARTGNELSVRGATIERADGQRVFRGLFSVEVSAETPVVAQALGSTALSSDSISVGQPIIASGEFSDDDTLIAEHVRLPPAQFTAEVVTTSPLAVDLFLFNGRRPAIYNFAGTGTTPENDADPKNYEIASALMPGGGIVTGDLIRGRGLVNEFGMAPADFHATTLIDVQNEVRAATLKLTWEEGTTTPFVSTAPERLDVDLSGARKALSLQGVPGGAVELMNSLALVAPENNRGVYAVKVRGNNELAQYQQFDELVAALTAQLDAGNRLRRITAQGSYTRANSELVARRAGFVFTATQTDG